MSVIVTVVFTSSVMQEREEFDDLGVGTVALGDVEPVRADSCPMG